MTFGMSTACFFPKLDCEKAVPKIGELGVSNAEIFFSTLSEYEPGFIKELRAIADDAGVSIYSVHPLSLQFEPQLFSSHLRSRTDALDIFEKVLRAGAQLGAKVYVMHGPAHVKRACSLNLDFEYVAKRTEPLCRLAQSYGIKLAWENVHWCWYAQPDFPLKLEEYLGSGRLFYTIDVKQAAQSGYEPEEYMRFAKGRYLNIHICDYIKTKNNSILPALPFEGLMDYERIKEELSVSDYKGAVILEVYQNNYRGYEHLLDTYNAMTSVFSI